MTSLLDEIMGGMPRQFTEADKAQIQAFEKRSRELGVAERQMVVDHSWLFCSCRPTWRRVTGDEPPSHAGCIVHHGFMITHDGRVL